MIERRAFALHELIDEVDYLRRSPYKSALDISPSPEFVFVFFTAVILYDLCAGNYVPQVSVGRIPTLSVVDVGSPASNANHEGI